MRARKESTDPAKHTKPDRIEYLTGPDTAPVCAIWGSLSANDTPKIRRWRHSATSDCA